MGFDLPFWGRTESIDLVTLPSQKLKRDKHRVCCNFVAREICDFACMSRTVPSLYQTDLARCPAN